MRAVLLGAAHIDRIGYAASEAADTSAPGKVLRGIGGVAYNVASGLAMLGAKPILVSIVGSDADGEALLADLAAQDIDASSILVDPEQSTATYHAVINDDGTLLGAVADMEIYESLTVARLFPMKSMFESANLVFVDANLPEETLSWVSGLDRRGKLIANSVSRAKAARLEPIMAYLDVVFTNRIEGGILAGSQTVRDVRVIAKKLCEMGTGTAIVSNGRGEIGICRSEIDAFSVPAPTARSVDETGAGDALVAGTLFGLLKGHVLPDALRAGLAAARICVETSGTALPKPRIGEVETALLKGRS